MSNIKAITGEAGQFTPTAAIKVVAQRADGTFKSMALLIDNNDSWLNMYGPCSVKEELSARLFRVMYEDKEVVGFRGIDYVCRNGIFQKSMQTVWVDK